MKRLLILLLASAALFCSCTGGDTTSNESELPADSVETPENAEEITIDELASYTIVRPERASKELVSATVPFAAKLRELSPKIAFTDDFIKEGSDEYKIRELEILIGATNRHESAQFIDGLYANDCGWMMMGDKLIIAGKTDELTVLALESFMETVLSGNTSDGVFYSSSDDNRISLEYKWDKSADEQLFIGEGKLTLPEFYIVYNETDGYSMTLAEEFASVVELNIRCHQNPMPDTFEHAGYAEVRFNPTDAPALGENEYAIFYDGYNISVCGGNESLLRRAMDTLVTMMDEAVEAGKPLILDESTVYVHDTSPLTAMSFNILYKFDDKDRLQRVVDIIEKYSPDTLGVQEAPIAWMSYLDKNISDDYAKVGTGRQGGNKDEFNGIFYKESVFELIDSGTKWLSDTPDKVSKYEDSACYRIFTYAHLRRKSDNSEIMVVNTHLDHVGADAKKKQANVLANFLKDYNDMPLLLTGDFNTTVGTTEYKNVLSGGVVNSIDLAETKSEGPTFTNFGTASGIIDFVFVTEDYINVDSYKVCGEKINGDYPSDHHPVMIQYTVK